MAAMTCCDQLTAQTVVKNKNSELGLFLGGSYYLGDINPGAHFKMTSPALGLLFRRNFNPHFAFRFNALYGRLQGDDANSSDDNQKERNLSFRSSILEFSGQLEFNFFPYEIGKQNQSFTPYVFVGLGALKHNPKAELDGTWYELQPLGTEGQETIAYSERNRYKLLQLSLPFGLGIKWNLTPRIGMALEWGMRKTFTDYLDDVSMTYADPLVLNAENGSNSATLANRSLSGEDKTGRQRGNSNNKDWYNFTGIMINFKIGGAKEVCPAYRDL
ncbi:MAG: outer membrane beta-barrel protein [Flavobacteriales bacterium]|nr:outer membrane beta-barrel protein [Flavobacteriales bacterium]